jgi:hypothetical protein
MQLALRLGEFVLTEALEASHTLAVERGPPPVSSR